MSPLLLANNPVDGVNITLDKTSADTIIIITVNIFILFMVSSYYLPPFHLNTTFGGHANTAAEYGMKILAQNVTGITVPNSGHFIQEEQPDVVVKLLNNFLFQ